MWIYLNIDHSFQLLHGIYHLHVSQLAYPCLQFFAGSNYIRVSKFLKPCIYMPPQEHLWVYTQE